MTLGKKVPNSKKLLDYLFTQPIVTAQNIADVLTISQVLAYKIIGHFKTFITCNLFNCSCCNKIFNIHPVKLVNAYLILNGLKLNIIYINKGKGVKT